MKFTEKEMIPPADKLPSRWPLHRVKALEHVKVSVAYEPNDCVGLLTPLQLEQNISVTIYESSYLFPLGKTGYFGCKTYQRKGYLSKFEVEEVEEQGQKETRMVCAIGVTS